MSRIGILPIQIPSEVTVKIETLKALVTGPKGELTVALPRVLKIEDSGGSLVVSRCEETIFSRAQHGLIRTLINNAVLGVSVGFSKKLHITGVGYKVQVNGDMVILNLGYSHPNEVKLPSGITAITEGNSLTIAGFDKQLVGQVAANIRALRKPEPYKGKGIMYDGERIVRKAGKATGAGK